ncbi:unnamed protein product [Arabidopsis halleri]
MEAPKSLLLFLICAVYFLSASIADDGVAMLALAKSFRPPPIDWSTTSSNNYCQWTGISCISGRVSIANLEKHGLVGFISPAIATLTSLKKIYLNNNKLTGNIPKELTFMISLRLIDVSNNNLTGKIPKFPASVKFIYKPGNFLLGFSAGDSTTPGFGASASGLKASVITCVITILLAFLGWVTQKCVLKKRNRVSSPTEIEGVDVSSGGGHGENRRDPYVLEGGIVLFSVEVLREATNDFSVENILGSGGFGTVYSGKLEDETKVAVKRMMNVSAMSDNGMKQFDAEIAVLAKVRHRHVIGLLGYSVNGDERLLVYEHMSQGNLGQHLIEPARHGYSPLTWEQRVRIALDVAHGVEYLHSFAPQSSIHRDLKSSNILLGDDMRAKVADFGLVKVAAADGNYSVDHELAGTFGYLAPEYGTSGISTTKVDVYAFGAVLMEMLTGRKALDKELSVEKSHLVTWLSKIINNKDKLPEVLDQTLKPDEQTMESIYRVAELAGHCTVREAEHRPHMGYAVNVLGPLVETWKPSCEEEKESLEIDKGMSLRQRVQRWKNEGTSSSMISEPLLEKDNKSSTGEEWKLFFEDDSLGHWEPLWT